MLTHDGLSHSRVNPITSVDRTRLYRSRGDRSQRVEFPVTKTEIHEGPDAAEFAVDIQLEFRSDPFTDTEKTDLDWGAFGFLFTIATLSFADARPREM